MSGDDELGPGFRLGKFRLERRLGAGGFGTVWRALDTVLQRRVAIKTLSENTLDADTLQRFMREAIALAAVEHPNVVRVIDYGVDGRPYIVMELLNGCDLETFVRHKNLSRSRLPSR